MSHQNIFKDKQILENMLSLRRQGWSLNALAYKYRVSSHHAIQYHCIKNGLPPGYVGKSDSIRIYHYASFNLKYIVYTVVGICLPERYKINQGKNYEDYLEEIKERDRKLEKFYLAERKNKEDLFHKKTRPIISVKLRHDY